jgi:hypothetical protein
MANTRIRLSPQTIDSVDRLGQQCGIEDQNTLIQLLIRKYGPQLVTLLSPTDPSCPELGHAVPMIAKSDSVVMRTHTPSTDIYSNTVETTVDCIEPVVSTADESPANVFFDMEF